MRTHQGRHLAVPALHELNGHEVLQNIRLDDLHHAALSGLGGGASFHPTPLLLGHYCRCLLSVTDHLFSVASLKVVHHTHLTREGRGVKGRGGEERGGEGRGEGRRGEGKGGERGGEGRGGEERGEEGRR